MPRTADDLESYLHQLNRRYDVQAGTYIVQTGPSTPPVAIRLAPPIVAIRVDIGPVPQDTAHQVRFFRQLLEYNATDLMHAAYAIEKNEVVLSAALALDNLDANELEASLSDIDMALARHIPVLREAAQS